MRFWLLTLLWVLVVQQSVSHADRRIALIIGNEDYPPEVGALANPHEDAELVADALQSVGFQLVGGSVVKDGDRSQIWQAVFEFQAALDAGGADAIGFFYYSGHGGSHEANRRRTNYLLPAKTRITSANQLPALGVSFPDIVAALGATSAGSIFVVSDACRNTLPFISDRGGAQLDRGFVPIGAAQRMLIAYSTADGETAPDDSKFAQALARYIPEKVSADRLFTLVGREVARQRVGGRYPVVSDRLGKDVFLAGTEAGSTVGQALSEPPITREVRVEVPVLSDDADAAFGSAFREDRLSVWQTFSERFPNYSQIAYVRSRIEALEGELDEEKEAQLAATRSRSQLFELPELPASQRRSLAIKVVDSSNLRNENVSLVDQILREDLVRQFNIVDANTYIQTDLALNIRPRFADWQVIQCDYLAIVEFSHLPSEGRISLSARLWDVNSSKSIPLNGSSGTRLASSSGNLTDLIRRLEAIIVEAVYQLA
ncbi:MAG: caspase family protein [Pseudomonadota bacterium]